MKTIVSLILLSFVGSIVAAPFATCSAHVLVTKYTGTITYPASGTTPTAAAKYCTGLSSAGCCDDTTINSFQGIIDTLSTTLQTAVTKRDKSIVEQRTVVLGGSQDKIKSLKTNADAASKYLNGLTASDSDTTTTKNSGAKALADALSALANDISTNLATLVASMKTFQAARVTCVNQLLKLQASHYCMSCDLSAADKGVAGTGAAPVITYDTTVYDKIRSSCFDYINSADDQSSWLSAGLLYGQIDTLNNALTDVLTKPAAKDTLKATILALKIGDTSATSDKLVTQFPTTSPACTKDACPWILDTFFSQGVLQTDAVVTAGSGSTAFVTTGSTIDKKSGDANNVAKRLLEQGRVLVNFALTGDDSKVTANFPENPGSVVTSPDLPSASGSELLKSGLVSLIVVMLSAFLI